MPSAESGVCSGTGKHRRCRRVACDGSLRNVGRCSAEGCRLTVIMQAPGGLKGREGVIRYWLLVESRIVPLYLVVLE